MALQMLSCSLMEAVVCQNVIGGNPAGCTKEPSAKIRKAYTITKQRERWSEEEHQKFLDALKLHGRGWRRIEEHIGSKTAVQIRSHAQKFFTKLEREASSSASLGGSKDIEIPPPRPKRKSVFLYPRKEGSPLSKSSLVEEDRQSSPPAISCAFTPPKSPTGADLLKDFTKVPQEEFKKTDASATSFMLFGKLIVPVSEELESAIMEESIDSLRADVSLESEEDSSITPINATCQPEVLAGATGIKPQGYESEPEVSENDSYDAHSSHVHKGIKITAAVSSSATHRNHAFHPETRDSPLAWQDIYVSLPVLNNVPSNDGMVYSPLAMLAMARKVMLLPETRVFNSLPEYHVHAHAHDNQYREQGSNKASNVRNGMERVGVCGENCPAECCSSTTDLGSFSCNESNFEGTPVWKRCRSLLENDMLIDRRILSNNSEPNDKIEVKKISGEQWKHLEANRQEMQQLDHMEAVQSTQLSSDVEHSRN